MGVYILLGCVGFLETYFLNEILKNKEQRKFCMRIIFIWLMGVKEKKLGFVRLEQCYVDDDGEVGYVMSIPFYNDGIIYFD